MNQKQIVKLQTPDFRYPPHPRFLRFEISNLKSQIFSCLVFAFRFFVIRISNLIRHSNFVIRHSLCVSVPSVSSVVKIASAF